jgi:hypothetical protein
MVLDAGTLLDPRFRELDPSPVEVPDAIREGRAAVREMGRLLRPFSDADLGLPWSWTGEGTEDVRTAAYLALAALHDGAGQAADATRSAGLAAGPAGGALAAVSRARWDLHGILGSLDGSMFDADPGGGEWTIREAVGHLTASQRSYAWFSAWWLARRDGPFPDAADPSHGDALPNEEAESSGSLPVVMDRIDALVDIAVSLWSPADSDTLAVAARWSGFPVTLGFRTHRWATHMEEHTVQVDKTLAMLGAPIPEAHRLHRLLCRAWGDVEAVIFALSASDARMAASDAVAGNAIRVAAEGALALVRDGASTAHAASTTP